MAKRRMFSESVVESDAFLEMPLTTQALYFHIGMKADDEGFCASAKTIMRTIGANQNDYDVLIMKGFVIEFASKVLVVKHWRINNYLQNDRCQPTEYNEEKERLYLKKNRAYTLDPEKGTPLIPLDKKCIQNVSIDKNRLDENRLDENSSVEGYGEKEAIERNKSMLAEKRKAAGYDDELF